MNLKPRAQNPAIYDAVIIGGGPAGSATATLLAQKGYRVLILERAKFPRFTIGESLIPETYWPLKRLGMLEKMKASHFVKKYSIQFISAEGRYFRPFYFSESNSHESSMTWQVLRSEFDQMMLDNAVEHGAEARQEVQVRDILLDGDRVNGVLASPAGGEGPGAPGTLEEIRARVVVDASGRSGFLGRRLHLRIPDPELKKMAYFAHYENVKRDAGIDGGATLVYYIRENKGWFWFIPLHDNITSIGVVSSPEVLQTGRRNDPLTVLEAEIDLCPALKERMAEAHRTTGVHVISDYSYRTSRPAGNGWVLVGDALGFLDPIYSSGVLLGLRSAELAADTIDEALQADDLSAERLSIYGARYAVGIENFRKLVYAFYSPAFSFSAFVRKYPQHRNNLIDLFRGDVFKDEIQSIFPALAEFFTLPEPIPVETVKV